MRIIGHDPGVTGGLVFLVDGEVMNYLPIPRREDKRIDAHLVHTWIRACEANGMISEKVHGMPHDTPTTAWAFSGAESAVVSAAMIAGLPIEYVLPKRWQKGILQGRNVATRKDRILSTFAFARESFPALSDVLKLKKNDGIASAACIAEFGWRLHNHKKLTF